MLGLALAALLGGVFIAVTRILPPDDGASRPAGSPTPAAQQTALATIAPTAPPPAARTIQVSTDARPSLPPPPGPFAGGGWVRLKEPLPVRYRPDPASAELYVLEPGDAAYLAEAPLLGSPTDGWQYVYAPSNGWVEADPHDGATFKRYDDAYRSLPTAGVDFMAAGGGLFVGVGWEGDAGSIISSADGDMWQATPVPNGCCVMAAYGPAGWLTVGTSDGPDGRTPVRQSADGATWSDLGSISVPGTAVALAGSDPGYVIVSDRQAFPPQLWFSTDGLLWTERPAPATGRSIAVVATPIGFVAWTQPDPFESLDESPASVAFSPDGWNWSTAAMAGPGRIVDVTAEGDHLLAATLSPAGIELWQGAVNGTGLRWFPQQNGVFDGSAVTKLLTDGQRTLALGWERATEAPLWWEHAGGSWQRHEMPEGFGRLPTVAAAAPFGMVAVGVYRSGLLATPVMWHLDGGSWRPESRPAVRPFAQPSPRDCGATPRDLIDLMNIEGALAAACFGDQPITVSGWTVPCGHCFAEPWLDGDREPRWLATEPSMRTIYLAPARLGTFGMLTAVVHPSLGRGAMPDLIRRVTVTGHFDDPAAGSCRIMPALGGEQAYGGRAEAIAACRARFVVTAVREIGP